MSQYEIGVGEFMGTGIIICGLNGAGKSTLGRVLAKELGFYLISLNRKEQMSCIQYREYV